MIRKVFFSFHYNPDKWRAAQVRNVGALEGNRPARDNDWETIMRSGDLGIKNWIDEQMHGRSCTAVLVGSNTANRKWINHEIKKSWNDGMGVLGVHIHGLKDENGQTSFKGRNPFDYIDLKNGKILSSVVRCYNPPGRNSKEIYDWITKNLSNAVDEAISIRKKIK